MSALSLTEMVPPAASPAARLRRTTAAVRVHFRWWGTHKMLSADQKEQVGQAYAADARLLTAGKRLVDVRHERFRALTSLKSRIVGYTRGLTLPYTEPGVRLIRQSDVAAFAETMAGFRDELREAETQLNEVYDEILADARGRLGRLFNANDYPAEIRGLFDVEWDFPSTEPPNYLMRLHPDLFQQEQERIARRFEEAVELAEQAFVTELSRLVSHLSERLSDRGEPKVFRDSAIENLTEFFERFRRLNVRSNAELEELVGQANSLVSGVTPQALRANANLRHHVAHEMTRLQSQLDGLLVTAPRRRIIRGAATNGVDHAVAN